MNLIKYETSCECNCQIGYIEYRNITVNKIIPLFEMDRFRHFSFSHVHLFNFCPMCGQELNIDIKEKNNELYFEKVIE